METKSPILKGHAYRPAPNPYGRKWYAGCECGQLTSAGPVNDKTARFIHAEHKKAIVREQSR